MKLECEVLLETEIMVREAMRTLHSAREQMMLNVGNRLLTTDERIAYNEISEAYKSLHLLTSMVFDDYF